MSFLDKLPTLEINEFYMFKRLVEKFVCSQHQDFAAEKVISTRGERVVCVECGAEWDNAEESIGSEPVRYDNKRLSEYQKAYFKRVFDVEL